VRLIYEVRRLGALPDDLPPFGDRADHRGEPLGLGRVLAASYSGERARSHALWVGSGGGIRGGYYDTDGNPLRKSFLKSPLNYRRISSRFSHGRKHPVTRKVVPHHGVDFAAATGTPVVATADGIVIGAGWDGPLGRAVRLRHGSEYVTVYGHLRSIAKGIRTGTAVSQNQVIGYVGSSGRATGPHLHYTVLHRGTAIDPMRMENPPVEPLPPSLAPNLDEAKRRWLARLAGIPASG
jgi:murein DD-endopeptidase MepM/ murein hydrolase activator NlpD